MEAKLSSSDQLSNLESSDYLRWLPEKDGEGYLRRMQGDKFMTARVVQSVGGATSSCGQKARF
jgi:hypothetical protein